MFRLSEGHQIKEKKISLFKQHVITAIKQQEQVEPNVTSDDIWQDVAKFVDRHSEDGTKYDSKTEKITIPVKLLKEMIVIVVHVQHSCCVILWLPHPIHFRVPGKSIAK